MRVVLVISVVYITFYSGYLNISFAIAKKRNNKKDNWYLFFLVIAMAILVSSINPPSHGWDLYRHYEYLDELKISNYGFFDYMFNDDNLLGGGTRSSLYGFKLLCYIVSKLDCNRMLPFLTLVSVYGIWCYITQDWLIRKEKPELLAPSFMVCLATMPYVYVNTGIRNALAASIVAWALYYEFEKKGSSLLTLLILLFSYTIHNAVIIVLPCWFLAHFSVNLKTVLLVVFGVLLFEPVAKYVYSHSIPGLSQAANLYLHYISADAYFFSYGYLIVDIVFILITVYVFYYENKNNSNKLYRFVLIYSATIMTQFSHYDLVLRPIYVLAMFSSIIVDSCYSLFKSKNGKTLLSILILSSGLTAVVLHGPSYLLMDYL